jgi:Tfp pilus assembly protein PilO
MKQLNDIKTHWQVYAAGLVAAGVVTVLGYFIGFRPLLAQYAANDAARAELTSKREEVSRRGASLNMMKNRLTSIRADIASGNVQLQGVENLNHRLGLLTELASKSGVKIDEIQPSATLPGNLYLTVPIRMSGKGGFPSCVVFLKAMRQTFPDIGVVTFRINRDGGTAEPGVIFTLDLAWHASPFATASVH